MKMQISPDRIDVEVQSRHELDSALEYAVELLKPEATQQHIGIEVTRRQTGCYTVAVSAAVPCGVTMQSWGEISTEARE